MFITNVEGDGPFVRMWAQDDTRACSAIEKMLLDALPALMARPPPAEPEAAPTLAALVRGRLYRARLLGPPRPPNPVRLRLVDYGTEEAVGPDDLRALDPADPLSRMPPQAADFLLAGVAHPDGRWNDALVESLRNHVYFKDAVCAFRPAAGAQRLAQVRIGDQDLSELLVEKKVAVPVDHVSQLNYGAPPPPRQRLGTPSAVPRPLRRAEEAGATRAFRSRELNPHAEHRVTVVHSEEGPELFAVRLLEDEPEFIKMQEKIAALRWAPPSTAADVGTVCLGRHAGSSSPARAVVAGRTAAKFSLFFVDFGFTETVSCYDVCQIPDHLIAPSAFAVRFCLSGAADLNITPEMKRNFTNMVRDKVAILRPTPSDGTPLVRNAKLFVDGISVEDSLRAADPLSYSIATVPIKSIGNGRALVSFVDGLAKFFVQLARNLDSLDETMLLVNERCASEPPLAFHDVGAGLVCCALFPEDERWYRARVIGTKRDKITVCYVDYGNEQEVTADCLRPIRPDMLKLSAQAIPCALKGYENKPFDVELSRIFESLTIERELHVIIEGIIRNDTLLVTLIDDQRDPAVSIADLLEAERLSQNSTSNDIPETKITPEKHNQFSSQSTSLEENTQKTSYQNPHTQAWDSKPKELRKPNKDHHSKPFKRRENEYRDKGKQFSDNRPPKNKPNFSQRKAIDSDTSSSACSSNRPSHWMNDGNYKGGREKNYEKQINTASLSPNDKRLLKARGDNSFEDENTSKNNWNSKRDNIENDNYSREKKNRNDNYGGDRYGKNENYSNEKGYGNNRNFDNKKNYNNYTRTDSSDNYNFKSRDGESVKSYEGNKSVNYLKCPAPLNSSYSMFLPELPFECDVKVSWFIDPSNFYVQCVSMQADFEKMMSDIPLMYKGVQPIQDSIDVGSAVLAQFPSDKVLCRARIVDVADSFKGNYLVHFIDFGNKCVVNKSKIWQLEQELLNLPAFAINCSLDGVLPINNGKWSMTYKEDIYFQNAQYKCKVVAKNDELYTVSLESNGASVDYLLISNNLAIGTSNEKLAREKGERVNPNLIVGQCFYSQVHNVESMSKFYLCLNPPRHIGQTSEVDIATDISEFYANQAVECSMYKFDPTICKVTPETFKQEQDGKCVIAYIDDILVNKLLVTLYDPKTGRRYNYFPDDKSVEYVATVCAHPVYNECFGKAYLSHIESINELYLQRSQNIDGLSILLDKLYNFYSVEGSAANIIPEIDSLCAAKSCDNNWYRAKIIKKFPDECQVQYIDYGNKEVVSLESLKVLDPQFFDAYEQALFCSLEESPFEIDVEDLKKFIGDSEIDVELSSSLISWVVNLKLNEQDVIVTLKRNLQPTTVESAEQISVYVSHVDSPGQFWLQLSSDSDKLNDLSVKLQECALTCNPLANFEIGTLCIAKYSADEEYYRAIILDSDSDITTVRFIDYGNTDVVDNNPDNLKIIPEDLNDIAPIAIKCSVNASPTGTGEWTEQASEFFTKAIGDVKLPILATIILKDITTYVDLFANDLNITKEIVKAGFATSSDKQNNGKLPTCFASHINSPSEFWIQLENSIHDLENVSEQLVDAENFPPVNEIEEGVICAAKFPEDNSWYRAKIIIHGSNGTEVLFMDYGNASLTSELRSLPENLKVLPALSRKCSLQKPSDIDMWSKEVEMKFSEIAADGATIFDIEFIASGDLSIVDLYIDNKSVTESLVNMQKEQLTIHSISDEQLKPSGEDYSLVHISYSSGPDDFWIQHIAESSKLTSVKDVLIDGEKFHMVDEPKEGELCAALFSEDNMYYRSKIIDIGDAGVEVMHIDYGTKAISDKITKMPADLENVPPLANNCSLLRDNVTFDISNHEKFLEFTSKPLNKYHMEIVDSTVNPILVNLFIEKSNKYENILSLMGIALDDNVTSNNAVINTEENAVIKNESKTKINNVKNIDIRSEDISTSYESDDGNVSKHSTFNENIIINDISVKTNISSDMDAELNGQDGIINESIQEITVENVEISEELTEENRRIISETAEVIDSKNEPTDSDQAIHSKVTEKNSTIENVQNDSSKVDSEKITEEIISEKTVEVMLDPKNESIVLSDQSVNSDENVVCEKLQNGITKNETDMNEAKEEIEPSSEQHLETNIKNTNDTSESEIDSNDTTIDSNETKDIEISSEISSETNDESSNSESNTSEAKIESANGTLSQELNIINGVKPSENEPIKKNTVLNEFETKDMIEKNLQDSDEKKDIE